VTLFSSDNGLPCPETFNAIRDNHGALWIYTRCGMVRIAEPEWAKWIENPHVAVSVMILDALEGAQAGTGDSWQPRSSKAPDGRLWFETGVSVQMLDPDSLYGNELPPSVHIEDVIANQKTYSPRSRLRLPALTRDLEIDYTALSFVVPQKVHFQYKLEGYARDWQDAGTRRQAFYSNLPPRNYTFRVKACNNSGLWNEAGAALDFNIAPAYYQTKWFLTLCIATASTGLYLLYFLRLKQATQRVQATTEARLAERERIARDLHDTLLQSVQGLVLKIHAVTKRIPDSDPVRQDIERALDYADQVLMEIRDRVSNLRTTGPLIRDLPAAFRQIADHTSHDPKMIVETVVEGTPRELHPLVLEEVFAVGREALINALSHSAGQHVEVEITYDARQFRLRVRDDGRGIDSAILEKGGRNNHWGLNGMRERASKIGGQLQLWSRPGNGTETELTVPAGTAYRTEPKSKKFWLRRSSDADD
jgi:signal transduction histidine kinase